MAIRVLFDSKELSSLAIMSLSQSGQLFDSTFKLGSTLCRQVKLEVNSRYVSVVRPSKVYIYDDDTIKFTLYIDNIEKVDDFTYSYTLVDSMVKLNVALSDIFEWDTSKSYTVQTIVDNICDYIGSSHVSIGYIGDLSVSWDWDTLARDFLSYVAEINASYVRINASGNVEFIEHKNATTHVLDVETCEDIAIGEYHCIQRVGYEQASASIYYPTSEVEYNTVYINQDNVLITDSGDFTREDIIKHIYDKINGFEFYCLTTSRCEVAQDCIAGDLLNTSVIDDKFLATAKGQKLADALGRKLIARIKTSIPTIAQIDWSYNAKWIGGYELDVATDVQEETQIVSETERKVRSLRITVDRELGVIEQEVKDVNTKVTDLGTELTTNYSTTKQTANAIELAVNASEEKIEEDVAKTYATQASLKLYVKEEDLSGDIDNIAPNKIASWIEASADNIIIKYTNSLIFGNYPDGQYMQARTNDSNTGVLFKGTGTFELDSVGDFNLINYADSEYSRQKNRIFTYTSKSNNYYRQCMQFSNYAYNKTTLANYLYMIGQENYNWTGFENKQLDDSITVSANRLELYANSDSWYIQLQNYITTAYKSANRFYLGSGSSSNLMYLTNFNFADVTYTANKLTLNSTSDTNQLTLHNLKLNSGLYANWLSLSSGSTSNDLRIYNDQFNNGNIANNIYMTSNNNGYDEFGIHNRYEGNLRNQLLFFTSSTRSFITLRNYSPSTNTTINEIELNESGLTVTNKTGSLNLYSANASFVMGADNNVTLYSRYGLNIQSGENYVTIKTMNNAGTASESHRVKWNSSGYLVNAD